MAGLQPHERGADTRPGTTSDKEHEFQLQRGQLLWLDAGGTPRHYAGSGGYRFIEKAPATSFERFWLADGFTPWLSGGGSDAGTDKEALPFHRDAAHGRGTPSIFDVRTASAGASHRRR